MSEAAEEERKIIPGEKVQWAGWLYKKRMTGMIDSWKRRFCIMSDEVLLYFEPKNAKQVRPHAKDGKCLELDGVHDVSNFLEGLDLLRRGEISLLSIGTIRPSAKNYRFAMILKEYGAKTSTVREYKFNAEGKQDRASFIEKLQVCCQELKKRTQDEEAKGIKKRRKTSLAAFEEEQGIDAMKSISLTVEWEGWLQKSGDSKLGSGFKWRFFTVRGGNIEYWSAPNSSSEKKFRVNPFETSMLNKECFSLKGTVSLTKVGKTGLLENGTCQLVTEGRIYVLKCDDPSTLEEFSNVISRLIGTIEAPAIDKEHSSTGNEQSKEANDNEITEIAKEFSLNNAYTEEADMSVEEDDDGGDEGTQFTVNFHNSLVDFDRPIENGEFAVEKSIEDSSYCCVVHVLEACDIKKNQFLGKADVKIKVIWDKPDLSSELQDKLSLFEMDDSEMGTIPKQTFIGETTVVEGTLDPKWLDQNFSVIVPPSAYHDLLLEVWDLDMLGEPELLGIARLSPADLREYGRAVEVPIFKKSTKKTEAYEEPEGEEFSSSGTDLNSNNGIIKVYIGLPGVEINKTPSKSSKQDFIADVAILEAISLPNGVTDPYVKLKWGPDAGPLMEIGRTSVIDTNMPPAWSDGQRFHIILTAEHRMEAIYYLNLEVWDYRSMGMEHIFVGSVSISSDFLGHLSHVHWLPLLKEGIPVEDSSLSIFVGYPGQDIPDHSRRLKLEYASQMESAYGHGDKTRNAVLATKEARAAEVKFEKDERAREALEASRQLSKKKKKKKKKNPDEIEWCVRVHMIELSDVPEAPAFGMMNTFVAFEMNSRQAKTQMRMNSETPRWAPPEVFVFKCNDVSKDILEVTVWMHSCVKKQSVAFGFILIPLADIRGLGFKKESYLIKSFESGQQQNTAVVMGIEVLDHEEAMGLKEDRVFEYEAYDFFKGGWSAKSLKSDEPRFVLDHNYGDHLQDRVEVSGDAFEDVDPGIPPLYSVERDWVTTLIHGGDAEGWDYATKYDSEEWFHENSALLMYRRKTRTRALRRKQL